MNTEGDNDDIRLHDGLYVDYEKFNHLAKEVLKKANVLRQKNLRSPVNKAIPRNSATGISNGG